MICVRKRYILVAILIIYGVILSAQEIISFSLVGDIMPGTIYEKKQLPAYGGSQLFRDATPIFNMTDFTLGNLETTLADDGNPRREERDYMFLTPISYGKVLKDAGIDYLSVANNHSLDFGEAGIKSTLKTLEENDILCGGLRRQSPYQLVDVKGKRVAICAFGFNYYCNPINKPSVVKQIVSAAHENADIVIVTFHGGAEGKEFRNLPRESESFLGENRGDLREFAHLCIDNGADIVFGHGPHVVRAVEMYKGRFIAYSLGNFCTPYGVSVLGINGYAPIVNVSVNENGEFVQGRIFSLKQIRGVGPRMDNKNSVLNEIRLLSDNNIANGAMNITSTGHIVLSDFIPAPSELMEEVEEKYNEEDVDWSKRGW